jgi:micrococcal nuclease
VRVIDGDTIIVGSVHVRLNGVDGPEVIRSGYSHDDDFGPEARDEMKRIIGDAVERSYERLVGICFLPDGTDIGGEIIRRGLALDCALWSSGRYQALEPDGVREIIHQAMTPR